MSDFKPKPLPKTALNEFKLRLIGPMQAGAKRQPTLGVSVAKNQPRIDVYTNVPNDKNNGNIRAAMDSPTIYALMELIRTIADGPVDTIEKINNLNHTFFEGKRSEHPKIISQTHVGKDTDGVVWIAVTAKDRPMIQFKFLPTTYHTWVHRDGSAWGEAELSVMYAKAYAKLMENLVANVLEAGYVEPEPRPQQGGGGGQGGNSYGGNRGGGGGNNYNRGSNDRGGNQGGGNRGGGNNYGSNDSGGGGEDFGDDFPM